MKRILRLLIVKRRIPMKSVPSVAETIAALLVLLLVGGPATAQETVKAKTSSVSQTDCSSISAGADGADGLRDDFGR